MPSSLPHQNWREAKSLSKEQEREFFLSLLDEIEKRCAIAGIPTERDDTFWDFDVDLTLTFPDGDGKRKLNLSTIAEAQDLLAIKFENVIFLPGYHAAISKETKSIIGRFGIVRDYDFREILFGREGSLEEVAKRIGLGQVSDGKIIVRQSGKPKSPVITLSNVTPNTKVLFSGTKKDRFEFNISNLTYDGLEEARSLLEDVSNSLFFQIEQETSLAFGIGKVASRAYFDGHPKSIQTEYQLSFPRIDYDRHPMTLYWHALSASEIPLMQFLSFYQAIEFYFQRYTDAVAKKRVSNILKRPNFRIDRSEDIDSIVNAARLNAVRGSSREADQLKNVISECITVDDLLEFARDNPKTASFLRSDRTIRAHQVKINTDKSSEERQSPEILDDVARRIYEIRCRIVHAKGDPEYAQKAPILPYTQEEQALTADISFIKFVAARIIAASAGRLLS